MGTTSAVDRGMDWVPGIPSTASAVCAIAGVKSVVAERKRELTRLRLAITACVRHEYVRTPVPCHSRIPLHRPKVLAARAARK
jgi:hypothetical protein